MKSFIRARVWRGGFIEVEMELKSANWLL